LEDLPIQNQREEHFDLPDEEILQVEIDLWVIYFDEASNQKGFGVGILLVSPQGVGIPI